MQTGPVLSRAFKGSAARSHVLHVLLAHLHSILLYLRYDGSCNSCEWGGLRSFKPSSGSHQELGQRPWAAAGARD
jgi:hypothetical protein